MSEVMLRLPEEEALGLYRLLHRLEEGQDSFVEAYRQLQLHFFGILTVEELSRLLDGEL